MIYLKCSKSSSKEKMKIFKIESKGKILVTIKVAKFYVSKDEAKLLATVVFKL